MNIRSAQCYPEKLIDTLYNIRPGEVVLLGYIDFEHPTSHWFYFIGTSDPETAASILGLVDMLLDRGKIRIDTEHPGGNQILVSAVGI